MTKPGNSVEIVRRQSDRLVEGLDAFAEPVFYSPRSVSEWLEKITCVWRQGAAQQLPYTEYSLKF
jgi:hypothetical protein